MSKFTISTTFKPKIYKAIKKMAKKQKRNVNNMVVFLTESKLEELGEVEKDEDD